MALPGAFTLSLVLAVAVDTLLVHAAHPVSRAELARVVRNPVHQLNADGFVAAIETCNLRPSNIARLSQACARGYNGQLDRHFPLVAFGYLRAQNALAKRMNRSNSADIRARWRDILTSLKVPESDTPTSTQYFLEHFWTLDRKTVAGISPLTKALTDHISDTLIVANSQTDRNTLESVIPAFRALAYLHKAQHPNGQYMCTDEFDQLEHINVSPIAMDFELTFVKPVDDIYRRIQTLPRSAWPSEFIKGPDWYANSRAE